MRVAYRPAAVSRTLADILVSRKTVCLGDTLHAHSCLGMSATDIRSSSGGKGMPAINVFSSVPLIGKKLRTEGFAEVSSCVWGFSWDGVYKKVPGMGGLF